MTTVAMRVRQEGVLARWWRTLRVAYWLGWKIESNWTDPLLFFIYSVARPLSGALILVLMYFVVARADRGPMLGFFVVGTACWPFVVRGLIGMAWGVIGDREHWKTVRYIYTAPISYRAYLVGRALAQATSAVAAAGVTLVFGRWVLGVPLHLRSMDLPYTLGALLLGFAAILALGIVVVSAAMFTSGEAWRMPEGVGAALYLICGAIFPIIVLPGALQSAARMIPLTWWLEAMRRGLLGAGAVRSFGGMSDAQVLLALAAGTAVWTAVAGALFTVADRRARQLGILDRESAY